MKKILTINSEQFLRGVSLIPYFEGLSIFDSATGVDIWRKPGLLGAGVDKTDLDSIGATVTDQVKWFSFYPASSSKCYAYGNTGRMYEINPTGDAVSLSFSSTASQANGLEIYKDYLIYARKTTVGAYGPLSGSPAQHDNLISGAYDKSSKGLLDSTSLLSHPIKVGPDDSCFVGDGHRLRKFTTIDSTTWTTKLTFQTASDITCLENDGNYLIIGITKYPSATFGSEGAEIIFWDTFSPSFNKKYPFPEAEVTSMKRIGNEIEICGRWGVYRCNYDNAPKKIIERNHINDFDSRALAGAVDEWMGTFLFGRDRNIWSWGTPNEKLTNVLSNPFKLDASNGIHALKVLAYNRIYVSADTNKLYALKSSNVSYIARTMPLPLDGTFKVEMAKVIFQTGASVTLSVQDSSMNNILSQTIDGSRKTQRVTRKGDASPIVDQVIFRIEASTATIKQIELFGTPVIETYAET